MKAPTVSTIVPCFNKAAALPLTLDALREQTIPHDQLEVILVDDGSTDDTERIVEELRLPNHFHYVRQPNLGASSARNRGASLAQGDILLFLDPDIILRPDALSAHLEIHGQLDRTVVTSRILPMVPNPVGIEDLLFQKNYDFGVEERELPWYCTITQGLSIKKAHFVELGCFSETVHRVEDLEFGLRARDHGFEIRYCPRAVGRHNHALDMRRRCMVERWNHQHLAIFFGEHPLLVKEMQYLRHKWPVSWQDDSLGLILRKWLRASLAWRPVLVAMETAWKVMRAPERTPRLAERLFWSIMGSYQLLGIRDGMKADQPVAPGFPRTGNGRERAVR
jgi:GT2 family glycosyltransferase